MIEELFENYSAELQEIYEALDLKPSTIEKIKNAVIERLAGETSIDPRDFLAIVENMCYSAQYTTKKGVDRNLSNKSMLKRADHISGKFLDGDAEKSLANELSDGNHDMGPKF